MPYDCETYLVSPFIENGTVLAYLKAHPHANRSLLVCLPSIAHMFLFAELASSQMLDVISALLYLYESNIVHGDIKGANVLVTASGHACLTDLGYSRLTEAAVLTWTSVQSILTLGTFPWQAPELLTQAQVGGRIVPTRHSDLYSVGCLLYEVSLDLSLCKLVLLIRSECRSSLTIHRSGTWGPRHTCPIA